MIDGVQASARASQSGPSQPDGARRRPADDAPLADQQQKFVTQLYGLAMSILIAIASYTY